MTTRKTSDQPAKPARKTSATPEASKPRASRSRKAAAPVVDAAPVVEGAAVEAALVAVQEAPDVQDEAANTGASEAAPRVVVLPTREDIARRAYGYWRAGSRDTLGNWLRAERELRG